jgi:hypothetical protein
MGVYSYSSTPYCGPKGPILRKGNNLELSKQQIREPSLNPESDVKRRKFTKENPPYRLTVWIETSTMLAIIQKCEKYKPRNVSLGTMVRKILRDSVK